MSLIERLELVSLTEFGITLVKARQLLSDIGLVDYARDLKGHLYVLYFAMASLAIADAKNILELGTGLGQATAVLSDLFPETTVYTIDLPERDRDYHMSWRKRKAKHIKVFKKSIARDNVIFIQSNTFFLPSLELPNRFELIWVDGGHKFPVVAWDIMFAYNHLSSGGFMLMHDYSVESYPMSQVKDVVDYMDGRIKERIQILPPTLDLKISENAKIICIRKM